MNLYPLIKDLESFLQRKLDSDTFLDRVQIMEDELIDFELDSEKRDLVGRENIINLMEIFDNINLIFEESENIDIEELEDELRNLIKIQHILLDKKSLVDKKAPSNLFPRKSVSTISNTSFIETRRGFDFPSPGKGHRLLEEPSVQPLGEQAPPSFSYHPDIKNKLPFSSFDEKITGKAQPFIPPPSKFEFSSKTEVSEEEVESGDLTDINLKSSPLYNLLNTGKNYSHGKAKLMDFQDDLERTTLELEELKKEILDHSSDSDVKEDFILIIEEILEELSYIGESMENRTFQSELNDFIELVEALNHKFIVLNKKFYHKETGEKEIIARVLERISEDEFLTSNFQRIKEASEKYFHEEIKENEFQEAIDDMLDLIRNCREEYEDTYISPEEWTLEVATGDKILLEGLEEWEIGLNNLNLLLTEPEQERLDSAIQKIFEANKKLVINQHLALYVKEQASLMDKYKELKPPGVF